MKNDQRKYGDVLDAVKRSEEDKDKMCDAGRIERTNRGITGDQRFYLSIIRWSVLFGIVCMFFLFRSCGGTLM